MGFSKDIYYHILEDAIPLIFLVKQVHHISELPFSKIAYANNNFFERMGINKDEMLNKPFRDFISTIFQEPDDVEKYFQILLREKRLFKMRVPFQRSEKIMLAYIARKHQGTGKRYRIRLCDSQWKNHP